MKHRARLILPTLLLARALAAGQTTGADPLGYSVPTPRPINPAESSTNPSAQATQGQNPYLGSVPGPATGTVIELSLQKAIQRGLLYNLGLIESNHASADVRGERLRALAALLPQVSARGEQVYESISYKEIGLKLPPLPGFKLPATTGGFGYEDARVNASQTLYDYSLWQRYKAQKNVEQASIGSIRDAKDVVVFAVATAYLQVVASASRVESLNAQLASARELDRQTADRVKSELAPEIDSIRAQVERQSAEQRLMNATYKLEKDKLTLGRITGFASDQKFNVSETLSFHALKNTTEDTAITEALRTRADLASAEASVRAAEANLRAQRGQRLPVISLSANYGGGGPNIGNMNQLYTVSGNVSVPIYTGGRIRADIEQAEADLARRQAEYEDLKGRVTYDVRTAWLDAEASEASVRVAERNKALAERALTQARDRYGNGVTNYLEAVQAEETVAAANDNRIESLYSFDVAMVALARAVGNADSKLEQLLGGN